MICSFALFTPSAHNLIGNLPRRLARKRYDRKIGAGYA
jgi:hypothetical protein